MGEQAIQGVIDQIWDTYDVDKSGALDKEETKKFVQDTLGNLGSGDEFSQEAFDEVFATFDKDGSGTVEKPEMVVFIKQLLGGNSVKRSFSSSQGSLTKMDLPQMQCVLALTSELCKSDFDSTSFSLNVKEPKADANTLACFC